MPSKSHAHLSGRAHPLLATVACAAVAAWFTGCATERLASTAPQGVDLSGEWRINWNLSDDPGKVGDEQKDQGPRPAEHSGHGGRGGGGGGGGFGKPGGGGPGGLGGPGGPGAGGLDPGGGGDLTNNYSRQNTGTDPFQVARNSGHPEESPYDAAPPVSGRSDTSGGGLLPVLYIAQSDDALPGSSSDIAPSTRPKKSDIRPGVAHMLAIPELLTISQSGLKLVVKSNADAAPDEYTAGEATTIPFGPAGADRSSGWRDSVFVVITKPKKGPSKEDDFTLDSEGHLIFATLVMHTGKGNIDFKRVYDRVRRHN
ncbi:MAG: hypothetical protein JWM63_5071 [Gammaproteobacteria bacterium]|nr:hypothetical protein [Gammaproteobacteria bacterium]